MVFLLRRRSGVAPFGSLQKSSVRSALVLLARAAPRCLKSQKIPVGCMRCSRIQRTFAHFGCRQEAGISWPCSQLLHSLFFLSRFERARRILAPRPGLKCAVTARAGREWGTACGRPQEKGVHVDVPCFVIVFVRTKESMRRSNGRSFRTAENVEQDIQRQRAEGGHGDTAVGNRAHP